MNTYRPQDITARAELFDLVYRYGHAVDQRDSEALVSCFAPDARFEMVSRGLVIHGADQIRDLFERSFHGAFLGEEGKSTHVMANTLVTLTEDSAYLETYGVLFIANGSGKVVVRGVRYSDMCIVGDRGWLILSRRHQLQWTGTMPGDPLMLEDALW